MRFKIKIAVKKNISGNKLPINYLYPLSSWIYHVIGKADKAYAYGDCLLKNLKEKYKTYYKHEYTGSDEFSFDLLSRANSRLITIKADTPAQTKIKGYIYTFRLKADEPLMQLAFDVGLGEKGSMGFGMIG